MLEQIKKLIDVKTIITFVIIGVIAYLGILGRIGSDKMFELGLMIVGFYFGTQSQKNANATAEVASIGEDKTLDGEEQDDIVVD